MNAPAKSKVANIGSAPLARGDHVELGERLVASLRAEAPLTFTDGRFYHYAAARGVFEPVEPAKLSQGVQRFAGCRVTGAKKDLAIRANDVSGSIKLASDQAAEPTFFESAKPGIAFVDCFVEVTADKIIQHEHSAAHRARFAYGFGFRQSAEPTGLLKFFSQVFRGDKDADQKVAFVQEYLGASMLGRAAKFQRALVMLGDGANGKGVISTLAERCMPPGSVCSVAPQDMGNEYRRAMISGKLLNVVSELPEQDIIDSEAWKAIVAGDTMTGRAIREAPITFRPIAGHVYSANRLPGTTDQTHGFWRRLGVVQFNRVFDESEQDPGLADKLTAELPAIVSWLLAGAQRLLAKGRYTMPKSSEAALDTWKRRADQVRAFIEDNTKPDEHGTAADRLYRAYRYWAGENGHKSLASNSFGERMRLLGLASRHTRTGNVYPVRLGQAGQEFEA